MRAQTAQRQKNAGQSVTFNISPEQTRVISVPQSRQEKKRTTLKST